MADLKEQYIGVKTCFTLGRPKIGNALNAQNILL
jgi:hypothetical protein